MQTKEQAYAVGVIYDVLAQLLPLEGRDYTIAFTFAEGSNSPSIKMTALTPFGEVWVDYCRAELKRRFGART